MAYPDFDTLLSLAWGWPQDAAATFGTLAAAANIAVGMNPPYGLSDLLAIYPKFLGQQSNVTGTVTSGSDQVTGISQDGMQGLAPGQLVVGNGIPNGTTILSVGSGSVTLTQAATANASAVAVYTAPLVPLAVLNAYIALASASLVQARWQEMWTLAMALYVAHYAELWLQSEGNPASNAAQAAQQGVARGIQIAKSVGDTSVSYQPLAGLEDWGAWALTSYGQQFATLAKTIGSGPMLIW